MIYPDEEIKQLKSDLRKEVRQLKKQADSTAMDYESLKIFQEVEQLDEFKTAKVVLAYWSMPDEVQTHNFVMKWYKQKQIFLPLVVGDVLELREFSGMECMRVGPSFGILEPQNGKAYQNQPIDFAVIPGVAFDTKNNRMGRGKGYYDKLLKTQNIYKVGVAFSFQMVPSVPIDSFDIPMDMVIYPK